MQVYSSKVGLDELALGTGTETVTLPDGSTRTIRRISAKDLPYDETHTVHDVYDELMNNPNIKTLADNVQELKKLLDLSDDILPITNYREDIEKVSDSVVAVQRVATIVDQIGCFLHDVANLKSLTETTLCKYNKADEELKLAECKVERAQGLLDQMSSSLCTAKKMYEEFRNFLSCTEDAARKAQELVDIMCYPIEVVWTNDTNKSTYIDRVNKKIILYIPVKVNRWVLKSKWSEQKNAQGEYVGYVETRPDSQEMTFYIPPVCDNMPTQDTDFQQWGQYLVGTQTQPLVYTANDTQNEQIIIGG